MRAVSLTQLVCHLRPPRRHFARILQGTRRRMEAEGTPSKKLSLRGGEVKTSRAEEPFSS